MKGPPKIHTIAAMTAIAKWGFYDILLKWDFKFHSNWLLSHSTQYAYNSSNAS